MKSNIISRAKACTIISKTIAMVKKSNFSGYFSPSTQETDDSGWLVGTHFISRVAGVDEHSDFFVFSDSGQEQIDRYFSGITEFLNQF